MGRSKDLADLGSVTSRLDTLGTSEGALSNRNVIINGNFEIWQRATAATAADNSYNTVDRFRPYKNAGAYTTERSDDNPHSAGFSLKAQCTTADTSIAAGEYAFINHEIDGQNLQHLKYGTSSAKSVTLSFWVKSSKTGTYTVGIYKHAGGATAYMYRKEYTISSANTWEKKIITVSPTAGSTSFMTSSGGKIVNGGHGFGVSFNLALGSNFHGTNDAWAADAKYGTSNQVNWLDSTSNNFYLAEVQMEEGVQATPFEHEPTSVTLAKCQRYTYVIAGDDDDMTGIMGYGESASNARFPVVYPVIMRTTPSFTLSGTCRAQGGTADGANFTSGLALINANTNHTGAALRVTGSSNLANDRGYNLQIKANGTKLIFDAEL